MSNKSRLMPRLRFPEFREAGEWEYTTFGVAYDVRDGTHDSPKYQSEGFPLITSKNLKNGNITFDKVKYISNEDYININKRSKVNIGDVLFAMIGTIGNPVIVREEPSYAIKNVALFKIPHSQNRVFLQCYLECNHVINKMEKEAKGTTQKFVSLGYLRNFPIPLPRLPEQQKIADCLSSLDDLITAQTQKLDGLKTHKKGLIQQLFPAEGETVPKRRFPEFQEAGAWVKKRLGEILTSVSNGLSCEQTNDDTEIMVTRIETISDEKIDLSRVGYIRAGQDISSYKLSVGDILFSNINSLKHIGKVVIIDKDYDLHHGMNLLRLVTDDIENNSYFLFYQLTTEKIRSSIRERSNKAVNQASINQTELKKILLAVPSLPEQKKIADCLSSIDDLIAAQAQKLDGLKTHKKGLMQQLFPTADEVNG